MVPKLHAKGTSFKGAAVYLLHDKGRADTSERVAWTHAYNIALSDPDMAWRIMAATAMDQDRLKSDAGVPNTGRKSDKHVLHMSLSWHPEETPSRDEMMQAGQGALKALGAEKHQALIIAHNDEKHAHIHLLINRVSPEDGRHLPSSKEKLKLSKWAQAYEEAQGQIRCEQRVINNDAREMRNEFTRASKDKARHIYEAEAEAQRAEKLKPKTAEKMRTEQREKDAALSSKTRAMHQRHAEERERLDLKHKARKARIDKASRNVRYRMMEKVKTAFSPLWEEHHRKKLAQEKRFDAREKTKSGRLWNTIRSVQIRDLMCGDGPDSTILRKAFNYITSEKARREAMVGRHAHAYEKLLRRQKLSERPLQKAIQGRRDALHARTAKNHLKATEALQGVQMAEKRHMQTAWKERNVERKQVWQQFTRKHELRNLAKGSFERSRKYRDIER